MAQNISKAVLVTGCSSGIGRATAERLARGGWTVYASARRIDAIAGLKSAGCKTIALDVCDESSMQNAVSTIEQAEGAIGVLINNAGYSQSGAIETVPMAKVRRQFETNVFGLVRLTQLVLPGMRRQHWGKVVNISSMGGKLVFPGGGFYHATKHALEAISDALRFEVRGFGIDVVVIEPGLIRTSFGDAAVENMPDVPAAASDYADFNAAVARATREVYAKGPLARFGGDPDAVAKVIERALAASRPRTRYTVTPSAKILMGQRRLMSDGLWDAFLRSQFPQPGKR